MPDKCASCPGYMPCRVPGKDCEHRTVIVTEGTAAVSSGPGKAFENYKDEMKHRGAAVVNSGGYFASPGFSTVLIDNGDFARNSDGLTVGRAYPANFNVGAGPMAAGAAAFSAIVDDHVLEQRIANLRRAVRSAWGTSLPDFRRHYDVELFELLGITNFNDLA